MLPPLLTPKATAYIREAHPTTGEEWVGSLPEVVARLAREWHLEDLTIHPGAGRSAVLVGTRRGERVVLKAEPDRFAATAAVSALQRWAVLGAAPEVLESGAERGAYLLAWVSTPPLSEAPDRGAGATAALARTLRSVGPPPPLPLRPDFLSRRVEQARSRATRLTHPELTPLHVDALASRIAALAEEDSHLTLLHADLTPRNVHAAADGRAGVLLLDPDPATGPLSFDLSYWSFRVGLGEDFPALARVAAEAAELDAELVAAWGPIHATTFALYQLAFDRRVDPVTLRLAHA